MDQQTLQEHNTVAIPDDADERVQPVNLLVERARELEFFDAHPELEHQLVDEWVALDGDALIAHGPDLDDVLRRAEDAGHPNPFVARVLDPTASYIF